MGMAPFLAPLSCSSRATGHHLRAEDIKMGFLAYRGGSSVTLLDICQAVTFPIKPAGGAPGPISSGGWGVGGRGDGFWKQC